MSYFYKSYNINSNILPLPIENIHASNGKRIDVPQWLLSNLKELGIINWFPVQQVLLSLVLNGQNKVDNELVINSYLEHDICNLNPFDIVVNSPTGSGKTLAYAVPILSKISNRIVKRLRALILLPTQDLVYQVEKLFKILIKGSSLSMATLTGSSNFNKENKSILKISSDIDLMDQNNLCYSACNSLVDIIIATPGRLLEHLNVTSGFNLSDIEYLVFDELDRLLDDDIQEWLSFLYKSLEKSPSLPADNFNVTFRKLNDIPLNIFPMHLTLSNHFITPIHKFLFSATITTNPSKLSPLKLHSPILISFKSSNLSIDRSTSGSSLSIEETKVWKYSTPSNLIEHMIIVPLDKKPLFVLYLMKKYNFQSVLIFTKSKESTQKYFFFNIFIINLF